VGALRVVVDRERASERASEDKGEREMRGDRREERGGRREERGERE
jgi:hypothetical protein